MFPNIFFTQFSFSFHASIFFESTLHHLYFLSQSESSIYFANMTYMDSEKLIKSSNTKLWFFQVFSGRKEVNYGIWIMNESGSEEKQKSLTFSEIHEVYQVVYEIDYPKTRLECHVFWNENNSKFSNNLNHWTNKFILTINRSFNRCQGFFFAFVMRKVTVKVTNQSIRLNAQQVNKAAASHNVI